MARRTMRAVQYSGYGGGPAALKHVEIPVPSPKKDEVLLKVEAAAINPIDCKIQSGFLRPILPPKFPFVPVTDIAGEIIEVGHGIIDGFKPGEKVVSWLTFGRPGGLAEYAVAPVEVTVHRPHQVSAAEGAALPIAALSALQALKHITTKFDGTGEPANVLVTAASGGVGTYTLQLAKLANLHVTATCGARNMDLVKSLGADEVLDYRTPEGKSMKSSSGRKYDLVVHCTTGVAWSSFEPILAAHGKVIDLTPSAGTFILFAFQKLTFSKKKLVPLMVAGNREELQFLVELVEEGKLRTVMDSRHELSKAEEAWAKSMEGHATGKIIVEM
ncbi:chloroplast envelope quinone oxidoreductase [Canna indica]|uniref:Chloroplast envelope quinone oxidoreductase n=1 Tax=Canna indica TaxID=4628 RepID=A0AAQ3QD90_9LILI|nr:chloroplast envelope quinone oxidoreductase [Canna indica]